MTRTIKKKMPGCVPSKNLEYISRSPEETKKIGLRFARKLKAGDIVALTGGLGTGKTTFVQGILDSFGVKRFARSASFVLVNEYSLKNRKLFHMDLYRLSGGDINRLGLDEYLTGGGITVIEWADKLKKSFLCPSYNVTFRWLGELKRKIVVSENIR